MRRISALVGKEIREHFLALILLGILLGAGYLIVIAGSAVDEATTSSLDALWTFLVVFGPLAGMVIGNRLVVAEFHDRTQLFVEALPVRRVELVLVKYALGGGALLVAIWAALGLGALLASLSEPIGPVFLWILFLRTTVFTLFLWSFLFCMGFLGRFRVPIYIALGIGCLALDTMTQVDLTRFGPLALVDPTTYAYERYDLPTGPILVTVGLAAGLLLLALLLALIWEGSVAEVLARRMSQKEKAVIGILFLAGLFAVTVLEERISKEPFRFEDDAVLAGQAEPVQILYLDEAVLPDARRLLAVVESDLAELRSALGWAESPPVWIAYRRTLDGGTFREADLAGREGVLVRANFRESKDWDLAGFRSIIVGKVLDARTDGRARFEPKRWLRDGFSRWWAERDGPRGDVPSPILLRALWATREEAVTAEDLASWLRYRERQGQPMAEAVAYSALRTLEILRGEETVIALARQVFGRLPREDIRETIYEWSNPMNELFKDTTGMAWQDFIQEWKGDLDELRSAPRTRDRLAAIPDGKGAVQVVMEERGPPALEASVDWRRPPAPGSLCSLLHVRLGPFDEEIRRSHLLREETVWHERDGALSFALRGRYGPGERVFVAVEIESDILGCPIRLCAKRVTIP